MYTSECRPFPYILANTHKHVFSFAYFMFLVGVMHERDKIAKAAHFILPKISTSRSSQQ